MKVRISCSLLYIVFTVKNYAANLVSSYKLKKDKYKNEKPAKQWLGLAGFYNL
jgi:hypothetical protein